MWHLKKKTIAYAALSLTLAAAFAVLASCGNSPAAPPDSESSAVTSGIAQTEPNAPEESISPPETEAEPEITESESAEEEVTVNVDLEPIDEYYSEVYEEILFGEYVPPETEPPKPETDSAIDAGYDPYVPSGNGRAPLALMYHLILDEPYSELESLFVRPSELEGHIEALIEAGYTFIFADEYDYSDGKTVIMSFDDGYLDNYTEMFPIIKKYNVKVTVFMIGSYIGGEAYLTEPMIREMAGSGLVSFQSHTQTHCGLTGASADTMRYEFASSKSTLEAITGREVKALCYPSGRFNNEVMAIASEYFDFAYTTQSSLTTAGDPAMALHRYRVSRGLSKSYFKSILP